MWHLRDPLRLSELQLFLPPILAQMAAYLDGKKDVEQIRQALARDIGQMPPRDLVEEALAQLDEALLLDNERSRRARADILQTYRQQPYRPAALAGISYPAEAHEVRTLFEQYAGADPDPRLNGWKGRALVSPHIDYQRGGSVYARVWRQAAAAVADADLVLIFGTDHNGGLGTITLTQLPYATPFGVLPAAPDVVQALAEAIGPDQAYDLELNHRAEHSVELSAVWLHHTCQQLGRTPPPMVPILCGSFHHFVMNGQHPARDETLNAFLEALRASTAGKKVLAVASVDLAHVGPVFGDPHAFDAPRRSELAASDRRLIAAINKGDYERFYDEIAAVQDRHRICGFSSTYLMLRYLQTAKGQQVAYAQCPADDDGDSIVSICGLLLT